MDSFVLAGPYARFPCIANIALAYNQKLDSPDGRSIELEFQWACGARRKSMTRGAPKLLCLVAMTCAVAFTACKRQPNAAGGQMQPETLGPGEFGKAVDEGEPAKHIQTFDALDFDVFSNQKWDRLSESHADDIIVSWPDGHDTRGLQRHIEDLKKLF